MKEALEQAREGRLAILERMLAVIAEPRPNLRAHAPRMLVISIDPEKIGAVIGPGGKTVRNIQDQTGAKIDIEDDGRVFISATDGEAARRAQEMVEALTGTVTLGGIYTGKVVRITEFGAFVEILPDTDGMIHVSQLSDRPVRNVADEVKVGQEVTVMVIGNENGKIRLSRRAVLEGMTLEEAQEADRGGGRGGPRRATNNGGKRPSPPTRGGGPERGGRAGRR